VRQVGYLQELYRDARSTKQNFAKICSCVIRIYLYPSPS